MASSGVGKGLLCFRTIITATRDCGRVTAILYSRLATRLRCLAIILPIHRYLLSLKSTFATVYL